MKKGCILAVFAIVFAHSAFAVEFTLGGGVGALMGGLFTRYTLTAKGSINNNPADILSTQEVDQLNFGGFLFLDATWAEVSFSVQGGSNTWTEAMNAKSGSAIVMPDNITTGTGSEMMLGFTVLGKYPIALNEQFTFYPLAGVELQLAVFEYRQRFGREPYDRTDGVMEADKDGNPCGISMWNSFLIDIGTGLDFYFHAPLYLKAELVYAFRLQTFYEVDALEQAKVLVSAPEPKLAGLTSGPALKIGLGWRFY
ncbi:MAG: hypothetical protein LBD48_09640 [Treponema sp.]|jgi:opacity protein-like surface antigen|nr:hypothetical protein [Treponema sp.]